MLIIRAAQIEIFQQAALQDYEKYARQHLQTCFPQPYKRLGDDVLNEVINVGRQRAEKYGFNIYRSLCTYLSLMFWLGSGFDEDPLYPWAERLLNNPLTTNQLTKVSLVQEATLDFFERAEGAKFEHIKAALARIENTPLDQLFPPLTEDFEEYMLQRLTYIHPQKCLVVGETDVRRLIHKGTDAARTHGFISEQSMGMYIGMMFMLGASFDVDPLLPWVPNLLGEQRTKDQTTAAVSLYRACNAYIRIVSGGRK